MWGCSPARKMRRGGRNPKTGGAWVASGSASRQGRCLGARLATGVGGGDAARRGEAPSEVYLLRKTVAATNQ
jgi:hypothetical protein